MLVVTLFLLFICFVQIDIVKTFILYRFDGCNMLNFVNKVLELRKSATHGDEEWDFWISNLEIKTGYLFDCFEVCL